jgi:hypothetical protein
MMLIGVIAIVMLLTGAINAWSIGLLFLFAAMAVGLGVRTQRKRSRVQGNQ